MRLLRNGRQHRAVGLYFSVKNGGHLPHESTLELHDLWRAEVDGEVVASRVQPFTLLMTGEGGPWRYTPDRLDLMADGTRRVVEVKPAGWDCRKPDLRARLEAVGERSADEGYAFEVH